MSNQTIYENVTRLTKREKELVTLIGSGLTNDEIAAKLFISYSTVKKHVSNITSKLNTNRIIIIVEYNKGNLL